MNRLTILRCSRSKDKTAAPAYKWLALFHPRTSLAARTVQIQTNMKLRFKIEIKCEKGTKTWQNIEMTWARLQITNIKQQRPTSNVKCERYFHWIRLTTFFLLKNNYFTTSHNRKIWLRRKFQNRHGMWPRGNRVYHVCNFDKRKLSSLKCCNNKYCFTVVSDRLL